jgi:hypothetical protein
LIIHARNPDFWDGKTNLIELFGEPWHPKADEEKRITHYNKHGYNCMVIWWEELHENSKTHTLENHIRAWYTKVS